MAPESLNPVDQASQLQKAEHADKNGHAPQSPLPLDSAVTHAEKVERSRAFEDDIEQRPAKKPRLEDQPNGHLRPRLDTTQQISVDSNGSDQRAEVRSRDGDEPHAVVQLRADTRVKGIAPIKSQYRVDTQPSQSDHPDPNDERSKDDAAEEGGKQSGKGKGRKKSQGQNTKRDFGSSRDAIKLCTSRVRANEFDPVTCRFGENCKFEHDIRKYLAQGKREDLTTFNARCPIFELQGYCTNGWKCRFASSHSEERRTEDNREELVLLGQPPLGRDVADDDEDTSGSRTIVNVISPDDKYNLTRRKYKTVKSEPYTAWLDKMSKDSETGGPRARREAQASTHDAADETIQDDRAAYFEPPFLPSEKKRIYYGPETPVLAPLTTQGNLPFRRLCVELGAQITWSEMSMGLPLIQGEKAEWALQKAHTSELTPPRYQPKIPVLDYDNAKDLKFGAQIAANKPWLALKTTEILTSICPSLRAVDLNCGCPIDLVYRAGAGSALLDTPGKLEKILRGMNAVSGEVPITVKIRTGTSDKKPMAESLVSRLAFGGPDAHDYGLGPCGVAAVTLHGRSRQQRYTRNADWEYIAKCAAIVKKYNQERDSLADTAREPDARHQANTKEAGRLYFVGNGDCYSHEDYNQHIEHGNVDSVMIARGALIKPWIFEELAVGQHLDKSGTERLAFIEKFVRNGLECWGSDEMGVGTTRRFLLEWLSFACRYVPVGMLEYLPPNIQDRPPAFKGRSELETLLCSDNYKDWIKISEMFLGKAHDNFKFVPKHKSNSYEVEAEG